MSPTFLFLFGLLAGSPPCPSATNRSPAGLNAAGDRLARTKDSSKEEEALACYQAAYASPPELRPAWACNNVTVMLQRSNDDPARREHAARCVEEARERETLAAAWFNLERLGVKGAALMSFLLRPTPEAGWVMTRYESGLDLDSFKVLDSQELPTGQPEIPVLQVHRLATQDGLQEWLQLRDPKGGASQVTVLPLALRRPGACAAGRTWELVNGRARIRATKEEGAPPGGCERWVAPVGDFPLEPFLARPMVDDVDGRKLPAAAERVWARHFLGERVGGEYRSVAAFDLDFDGDLDWLVREDGQTLIIENAAPPRWLGRVYGMPLTVERLRVRGRHVLTTYTGAGPEGSLLRPHVFDGKRYVEDPKLDPNPPDWQ